MFPSAAAADDARHRPDVPSEAGSLLAEAVRDLDRSVLLDLGTGTGPRRSYEDGLAASAFSEWSAQRFPVTRLWTPDDVIGYLRGAGFARPGLFADRHAAVEAGARRLPDVHARGGVLKENAVFAVLLAHRPGGAA